MTATITDAETAATAPQAPEALPIPVEDVLVGPPARFLSRTRQAAGPDGPLRLEELARYDARNGNLLQLKMRLGEVPITFSLTALVTMEANEVFISEEKFDVDTKIDKDAEVDDVREQLLVDRLANQAGPPLVRALSWILRRVGHLGFDSTNDELVAALNAELAKARTRY